MSTGVGESPTSLDDLVANPSPSDFVSYSAICGGVSREGGFPGSHHGCAGVSPHTGWLACGSGAIQSVVSTSGLTFVADYVADSSRSSGSNVPEVALSADMELGL